MARTLPELGQDKVRQLEEAWGKTQPEWARKRLLVLRMIAQHELDAGQIARIAGVARCTVFVYLKNFQKGGVPELLRRDYTEHTGMLEQKQKDALSEALSQGRFQRAKDVQAWLKKDHDKTMALSTIYYWLGKVGGVLKMPRKTHAKKDPLAAEIFKFTLPERLAEASEGAERTRLWVLDEHRYGLLPVIRRCWALKGVRVYAPYATKYQWGYLHEALEVDGENKVELLMSPTINQDWHLKFLQQISESDPQARHIVIADQAGFHLKPEDPRLPSNLKLVPLPPYSPELNPVERFGDLVKDAICNKLYPELEQLEEAIMEELKAYRENGHKVAALIGDGGWLEKVNYGVPI
jgi:transposase